MSRVLVVGSGGREHAVAWKLAQDPSIDSILLAPGNDGILEEKKNGKEIRRWRDARFSTESEILGLVNRAREEKVSLAVIGPDHPLSIGIVDHFQEAGVQVFGPNRKAAQIESSKSFGKEVMRAAGVPTADFFVEEGVESANARLKKLEWGGAKHKAWVVKADGLALGKGVQVCENLDEALHATKELSKFSSTLIIEERLSGEELSVLALCDGETAALFPPSRDYKRLLDRNLGPNTGGMGAYCPVPEWNEARFYERFRKEIFLPVLKEMGKRGTPFHGVLYAGLMVDRAQESFHVLEFNARFGDPETQVLLPSMKGELYPWLLACVERGGLKSFGSEIPRKEGFYTYVVAVSKGYPGHVEMGDRIEGASLQSLLTDSPSGFFSGVKKGQSSEVLSVSGGRVLGALGWGSSLSTSRDQAYLGMEKIRFPGMHSRKDIAK